jgi:hypothetical protein
MGLAYDSKSRVVVLYGGGGGSATPPDDTWTYDPARNVWTDLKPETSPGKFYKKSPNGVSEAQMMAYDQEHNVHVLVLQNWQVDNAVWAYRYKK